MGKAFGNEKYCKALKMTNFLFVCSEFDIIRLCVCVCLCVLYMGPEVHRILASGRPGD